MKASRIKTRNGEVLMTDIKGKTRFIFSGHSEASWVHLG